MNTPFGSFLQALAWYGDTFLGSAPALFAVLGFVLWALGGATMGLHLRIHSRGYLTPGFVLGTVSRPRVSTSQGGAGVEDSAQFLAVAYRDDQGQTRNGLLSEWEESYAWLPQDQPLTLRVVPNPVYDDLYLAGRRGASKLALVFMVTGCLCLFRFWHSQLFWASGMVMVLIAAVLSFLLLGRVPAPADLPPDKCFHPDELRPMPARPPG